MAKRAGLSTEDKQHLQSLESKLQLVRDRTQSVVLGYANGFYLHGEGGTGKSYTVLRTLEESDANYKVFNSRMTGRGLYNSLEKFPDAVHVLEDMESLVYDKGAQGVLRSALWGQRMKHGSGKQERLVTWTTYKMEHSFYFTGGVIITANRALADLPELRAVSTRIPVMHLEVSDLELRAMMRNLSGQGYQHDGKGLSPDECLSVCEFLISESQALHRTFDIRLLENSWLDFLQSQEHDANCHWHDLVRSRVRQRPTVFEEPIEIKPKRDRIAEERLVANEIADSTSNRAERIRQWKKRTGKSRSTFDRRLAEAKGVNEVRN